MRPSCPSRSRSVARPRGRWPWGTPWSRAPLPWRGRSRRTLVASPGINGCGEVQGDVQRVTLMSDGRADVGIGEGQPTVDVPDVPRRVAQAEHASHGLLHPFAPIAHDHVGRGCTARPRACARGAGSPRGGLPGLPVRLGTACGDDKQHGGCRDAECEPPHQASAPLPTRRRNRVRDMFLTGRIDRPARVSRAGRLRHPPLGRQLDMEGRSRWDDAPRDA